MIHNRTMIALAVALLGGYLGGYVAADTQAIGMAVAFLGSLVALTVTPHAETVATEWDEHDQTEDVTEVRA